MEPKHQVLEFECDRCATQATGTAGMLCGEYAPPEDLTEDEYCLILCPECAQDDDPEGHTAGLWLVSWTL